MVKGRPVAAIDQRMVAYTLSCHLMPRIRRWHRMWHACSRFVSVDNRVHVYDPYYRGKIHAYIRHLQNVLSCRPIYIHTYIDLGYSLFSKGGATIGSEGVIHPPPISNFSVFTVLTPYLPMH